MEHDERICPLLKMAILMSGKNEEAKCLDEDCHGSMILIPEGV